MSASRTSVFTTATPRGSFEVQRDVALVAVDPVEIGRRLPARHGACRVRAAAPPAVDALDGLDLDHVGASVRQDLCQGRAGQEHGQVKNTKAFQRQRIGLFVCPATGSRGSGFSKFLENLLRMLPEQRRSGELDRRQGGFERHTRHIDGPADRMLNFLEELALTMGLEFEEGRQVGYEAEGNPMRLGLVEKFDR